MSEIFLSVVNMSISAGWIVLAVLLLRLLLKKAPKWITVLLWAIVAVRLVCPFSIESAVSLVPSAQTISPEIMMDKTPTIDSGIPAINNAVNPIIEGSFAPEPSASANPLQILVPVFSAVWLAGICVMLLYTAISYFRVKSRVGTAVLLRQNIFQSERVASPFVLGIIKPKIYLPFSVSGQDMEHVIAHESAHIRRKDHLWKPLGFLILSLHWFNPLVWLGYLLLCRDIELACDEKVVKELSSEQKADYSQALLSCSVNRRAIAACPLAFGEVGVKNRVKSVLNYKKPAFWIIAVAVIASVVVAVCFLTNPVSDGGKKPQGSDAGQSDTSSEIPNGPTISRKNSKNDGWVACETLKEGGKPVKSTHFDPTGKKVTEVSYDSEGNKTYTYFYEDGRVAPARTYDISWYEDGSYLYSRFYYDDDGKISRVNTYCANETLSSYSKYNNKGEIIEEVNYNRETGEEAYHLKMTYKYRSDGSVSEIVFRQGDGSYYQTYFVNKEGLVTGAKYADGWSEEFNEPLIGASIYYEPRFSDEY